MTSNDKPFLIWLDCRAAPPRWRVGIILKRGELQEGQSGYLVDTFDSPLPLFVPQDDPKIKSDEYGLNMLLLYLNYTLVFLQKKASENIAIMDEFDAGFQQFVDFINLENLFKKPSQSP
ncbi:MAG: hypothetical protein WAP51_00795 [Candidatus Sungiibacteriota bacterium]